MNINNLFAFCFVFFSMLTTNAESIFEDEDKLVLVHVSKVMSENSTKIAGSQIKSHAGQTYQIEPSGTNLNPRITLHHCLGKVVPSSMYGEMVSGIFLPRDLGTDIDSCAYLDPLSSFKGEVFGGRPHDFMTIHSHTYGKRSIVVVPTHRV